MIVLSTRFRFSSRLAVVELEPNGRAYAQLVIPISPGYPRGCRLVLPTTPFRMSPGVNCAAGTGKPAIASNTIVVKFDQTKKLWSLCLSTTFDRKPRSTWNTTGCSSTAMSSIQWPTWYHLSTSFVSNEGGRVVNADRMEVTVAFGLRGSRPT